MSFATCEGGNQLSLLTRIKALEREVEELKKMIQQMGGNPTYVIESENTWHEKKQIFDFSNDPYIDKEPIFKKRDDSWDRVGF